MKIEEIKEQCEKTIKTFPDKVLPIEYIDTGIMLREGFAFCSMAELFNVDYIIESGVRHGFSTEIWAGFFPDKEIYAIDIGEYEKRAGFDLTRKRLEKHKNIHFVFGDSKNEIPKILQTNAGKTVGVCLDGPKDVVAINLAKTLFNDINCRFVGIHDQCHPDLYHTMASWDKSVWFTDDSWFVEKYSYIECLEDYKHVSFKKDHFGGIGFAVNEDTNV